MSETHDHKDWKQRSYWSRLTGGRSIFSLIFGEFLADKNNAASIVAIILVLTLCCIVAIRQKFEFATGLLNIVFVVIGYYFGSKREVGKEGDEDD